MAESACVSTPSRLFSPVVFFPSSMAAPPATPRRSRERLREGRCKGLRHGRPPGLRSKPLAAASRAPRVLGHFSCEIGGCFFGINKHARHPARSRNDRSERGRHHTKGTRYVGNSLAALLGASAAIWSKAYTYTPQLHTSIYTRIKSFTYM